MGHNYLLTLEDLASKYGIPVVLYDQLGIGKSTHLPEKNGDAAFWTVDLFLAELENLLKHLEIEEYDVYGNSWGGMLGAEHAVRRPQGLRRLIIADSPASMVAWVEAASRLRAQLPKDVEETLKKHEESGTTETAEYEEAVLKFYARHVCRIQPAPEYLVQTLENVKEDPTVYHTMCVDSEGIRRLRL